ncbi:MAG: dihydrodipicolinate synthase family protein [Chloroflexi bacterium]|nr:dihydrodipicolinate synthase family protein [Chloroflexota bacterium]
MTTLPLHERLRGIVTVLNTPFSADDQIDHAALAAHTRRAVDAGIAGILYPAMASEVLALTETERDAAVQTVLAAADRRVTVIGGASAAESAERARHAARLTELGCDGVLVSIPYESDADYTAAVRAVAAVEPGFLMLQDWASGDYGLPVPLIVRLFDAIPAFQSLKIEVVPAGVKYSEVLHATDGRLHIAGGWAVMQMIEALDRGVHTVMPTAMHPIYTHIDRLYRGGDREAAQRLFRRVLPVLAFSNQHLDISIHFFKRLLWRQGIYPTSNVRAPVLPFDDHHARSADDLIDLVLALETELGA